MNLSELQNGKKAYISTIKGTGAFRQRIIEMGFIEGKEIEAVKRAPFQDPAEFSIMGYNVSIRHHDAELIEITDFRPDQKICKAKATLHSFADSKLIPANANRPISIALVGNPNCGKTTIFNFASNSRERVANYTGVTVSAKEAIFETADRKIKIVDLPGTYSLSSYSPEELYVIDYLTSQSPDVVVNVIDASNLERNLYLTTQLLDMGHKVVIALNMYDELSENGDKLDHIMLGKMLGVPVVPTVGTKGEGIAALIDQILAVTDRRSAAYANRMQLKFGSEIDEIIDKIARELEDKLPFEVFQGIPSRFLAIKLLEGDTFIKDTIKQHEEVVAVVSNAKAENEKLKKLYAKDAAGLITDARYGYIAGALNEVFKIGSRKRMQLTQKIDFLLTNRLLGIPVFFALIWFTFYCTFKIGEYPVSWIESLLAFVSEGIGNILPVGIFHDLMIDGIIGGIGGVIVFLPSIMILFLFISLMEDTGYMARTAFLMDKAMHKMGLHGKSFIPMLMGFGCNVPAVMATRTIESKRDRILTMSVIPFMSCSARLPVYVLFISAFFPMYKGGILFGIYMFGILAAFLTAVIFSKTVFKKVESPFVMELPPYRFPTLKAIMKHMWFKSSFFLKKMGTIILVASIIIWALGYFPRSKAINDTYNQKIDNATVTYNTAIQQAPSRTDKTKLTTERDANIQQLEIDKNGAQLEQSYISRIGKTIEPVFAPLGFDWKMTVSILTGVLAKEIVVSSMGVLYQADNAADENSVSLKAKLQAEQTKSGTPLFVYLGFLVFILLYFPCIGTLTAMHKETGSLGWVTFEAIYPTAFAWIAAYAIFLAGTFIF